MHNATRTHSLKYRLFNLVLTPPSCQDTLQSKSTTSLEVISLEGETGGIPVKSCLRKLRESLSSSAVRQGRSKKTNAVWNIAHSAEISNMKNQII
ncbi:MAG: hypothetical protein OER83_08040 [Flavobacteriaceae bacterium]|nr:hypothetical protein [Flavobacteriaceae bacterium]